MRTLLLPALLLTAIAVPVTLTACASDDSDANIANDSDDLKVKEGGACNAQKKCKAGLLCKASDGAPTTSNGHPVMGMVVRPMTCQKPGPGEEGGTCSEAVDCDSGLTCDYGPSAGSSSSGGPPPGALGMPIPSSTSKSSGPPPGAMGMPVLKTGTCKPSADEIDCPKADCGPELGMPTTVCADGSTGGPTGHCIREPGKSCHWEVRACPPMMGMPIKK